MLRPANHLAHDLCHLRLCCVGSFLNLLVADFYRYVEASQVGDDADAENLDATMASHDDLGYGTHAYSVASQQSVHAILGRSLEGRTLYAYVYSVLQVDALLLGYAVSQVAQTLVVSLVHVGESRTCGEVLATKRMLGEEVDMVVDHHQVAYLEGFVHATRGVADEEGLDAQLVHHTLGECHLFHVVTLIEVETSLHRHDVLAAQLAEDQFAGMAFYG